MEPDDKDANSLEGGNQSVIEAESLESADTGVQQAPEQPGLTPKQPGNFRKTFGKLRQRFNIYLILFILILVISSGILTVSLLSQHRTTTQTPAIASQSLSTSTLKQLGTTDATVGGANEVLNVQSNAVFAGKVLIQGSLDVAGAIHVGGALALPGINVSGNSTLDQVQVNKTLSVGSDASLLGQLTVKKNLIVSGSGSFGGSVTAPQITTNQLQILNDLDLTSHVVAGGATPVRVSGSALGSGGTASISGSDTAGSININTGNSPSVGCFLTVNFTAAYQSTPHVVISPTSMAAATVGYYVTKSTSGFSVCASLTPPSNSSLAFDYIVLG